MRNTVSRNLKFFVWTGGSWAVFDAFTAAFMSVFVLALGASNTVVGLVSAITFLAALVSELPGALLSEVFPKRELIAWTGLLSRLLWIVVALVPFVADNPLWWVVSVFAVIRLIELLGDPAWTAFVADIVPKRRWGAVLARRNVYIGIGGLLASLIGGFYLDLFPKESALGFSSLFVVGTVWSFLTFYCVMQIRPPPEDYHHHGFRDAFPLPKVLWKFSAIYTVYYFTVMIASPFFAVYLLKDLGLGYSWFVIAGGIATVARILAQPHFGRLADRVGDRQIALVCMFGTALVPLSYLFISPATWLLIVPAQIFSGIVWAGVDLAVFNLLLGYTDRRHRAAQSAVFTMLLSVSSIVGPLVGGWLSDTVIVAGLSGIPLIFAIAAGGRMITAVFFLSVPEVRVKRHYPLGVVVREILGLHPNRGYEGKILSTVRRER
ncbi:MFS transporter [Candidatus Woesearchaeota archaeon]|nr:MFS transporter [Candidatus Woesearchaeota archaeon]